MSESDLIDWILENYVRKEDHKRELEELEENISEKFRKELEYELKVLRKELEDLRWKTRDLS